MSITVGQASTRLTIDSSQLVQGINQARTHLQAFGKSAGNSTSQVSRDFANIARQVVGVTAIFTTLKKVIGEGLDFNKFMQEQTAAFSVMLKSTDVAKAKMKELFDFAVNSPLTFKETVSASKQLLAYGFGAETLVDNMKMLGTVAKATGKSLDDISYVYGTLKTQGRAYTRDLMQFAMRGIPIYDELAKVMGVDVKQVQKLTEAGKVGFAEVEQAFKNITGEGGRFFGMMDEYMKTLPGQMSMLGDILQQSAGSLAQGITDELVPAIKQLIEFLNNNKEEIKTLGYVTGQVFKGMVDAVAVLIKAFEYLWPVIATGVAYLVVTAFPAIIAGLSAIATSLWAVVVAFAATGIGAFLIGIGAAAIAAGLLWDHLNKKMEAAAEATRKASKALEVFNNQSELRGEKGWRREQSVGKIVPPSKEITDYMDKLRAEYAKFLAEKRRDDEYIADAVVNYEHMVRIEEAKKLFGDSGPLFTEAKRYIDAMSEYEAKALREAQTQAWKDSLQSYQDKYDTMVAQQQVVDMTNIYAVAELEYEAVKKTIAEKFKGNEAYKNQALEIAKKLHTATMENIKKEADRRIQDAKNAEATLQGGRTDDWSASRRKASDTGAGLNILGFGSTMSVDILGDLPAQALVLSKNIKSMNDVIREAEQNTDSASIQTVIYYKGLRSFTEKELKKLKETARKLADAYVQASQAAIFDNSFTDPTFWEALKAKATLAFQNMQILGAQAGGQFKYAAENKSMATPEGTPSLGQTAWNTLFASVGSMFEGIGDVIAVSFEDTIIGKIAASSDKFTTAVQLAATALMDFAKQTLGTIMTAMLDGIHGLDIEQSAQNIGNGIADFINTLFGLTEVVDTTQKAIEGLRDVVSGLDGRFNMLVDAAKSLSDAQIGSLQDLYEVGAISGAQYSTGVSDINTTLNDNLAAAYLAAGKEFVEPLATDATLQSVFEELALVAAELGVEQAKLDALVTPPATAAPVDTTSWGSDAAAGGLGGVAAGAAIGSVIPVIGTAIGAVVGGIIGFIGGGLGDLFGWWDVGATNVPKDQMGTVHAGEAIIPKTFADGIRSGEMVLSGQGGSSLSSGDVYVTVNVAGSVSTENDLASSIAKNIYTQRKRGLLTV